MSLLDVFCFFLVPCWCCRLSSSELLKLLLSDAYLLRRWKKTGTGRASHHSSVSTIAALRSCDYLQILTANTRLQKDLLDASNKACAEAAELEALSRQQLQHMLDSGSQQLAEKKTKEEQHEEEDKARKQQQQQTQGKEAGSDDNMEKNAAAGPSKEETAATVTAATADGGRTQREDEDLRLQQQPVLITLEKVAEAGAVVMKEKRELLESLMKRCRMLLDACNGLIVDLDSLDFSTLKPLWGDERSVRQSRKCLTQLIEKMTDRLEVANKFLKNIFVRLPPPPSSPLLDSSRSGSNASQGVPHRGPADIQAAAVAGTAATAGTEASAGRAATAAGGAAAEFENGSPDGVCASATKKGASAASLPSSPSATAMTSSFLLPPAVMAASSFSSVSTTEAAAASERRDSTDEPTGLKAGDLRGSEPGSPSVVGRGRGVLPGGGAGRGRGVLVAAGRGRGAGAGRGASSPSSSSSSESDDDSDRQQQAQPTSGRRSSSSSTGLGSSGGRRGLEASADAGNANTAPAAAAATATAGGSPLSPKKRSRYDETQQQQQGEEEEEKEAAAAAAEYHRVNSRSARDREEGDMPPSRWKRKQAANVDWLLKCRTKLCELKERTVRKAVSDVFIKERTVQETIEFMNHNADKLQTVAEKPKAAITSDDRRIFMRSIESYIAGLDKACSLVAKQAMNKRQLMSLFESACKVEKFQTPHELLLEVKNTVSLLQTFAYMPPSRDDDSS